MFPNFISIIHHNIKLVCNRSSLHMLSTMRTTQITSYFAKRQKIESEIMIRSPPPAPPPQCNDDGIDSTEVWRLVTRQDFLTIQELARFLLLTSKSFVQTIYTQHDIWMTLLHARFNIDILNLLKTQPISPKQLFFSLNKGESRRPSPPVHKLQYQPDDYLLIVNLFSSNGQAFYSKTISSSNDDLKTFLDDGKIVLPMDVACPPSWQSMVNLTAVIHLYRIPDQKMLCLFQSNSADWMDENWLWLSIENDFLEMDDLEYARMLYSEVDRHGYGQGIYLDVNLYTEYSEDRNLFGCSCGLCYQGGVEMCKALGIEAQIRECDDDTPLDNKNVKDRGGVTFAHFLENAYGWST